MKRCSVYVETLCLPDGTERFFCLFKEIKGCFSSCAAFSFISGSGSEMVIQPIQKLAGSQKGLEILAEPDFQA